MTRLDELGALLAEAPDEVFLQPHNVPDPDAIASCHGLQHLLRLGAEDWAVLVDAQKDNANLTDLETDEVAVIDHHEYLGAKGYRFEDVRPNVGSCSAIVAEYYFDNATVPPPSVATALLYGILMDTDNLTRGAAGLDIDMLYRLYGLADIAMINELKGAEIRIDDLALYADAFRTVEVYDRLGFLRLESANDSLLGAASDAASTP